jgi:hypothetical protein
LDETGSKVWQLIDGRRKVDEICTMMSGLSPGEFDASDAEQVRVTKFLSHLYKNRFIEFREI